MVPWLSCSSSLRAVIASWGGGGEGGREREREGGDWVYRESEDITL